MLFSRYTATAMYSNFSAPLKGIPSRVPTSGFRSPSLTNTSMANRTSISSRIRKDGGIKLLDINEQPLGYAQAKKRRKLLELEEQQKKVAEAQAQAAAAAAAASAASPVVETPTTPEYAQGLTAINPPATPVAPTVVATVQSYTAPSTPSSISVTTTQQTRKANVAITKDNVILLVILIKYLVLHSYYGNYYYHNSHYCTSSSYTDGDNACGKHTSRRSNSQTGSNGHADSYTDYHAT